MQAISLDGNQLISNENMLLKHRELNNGNGVQLFLTSGYAPQGVFLEQKTDWSSHQATFNFCQKGRQFFNLRGNYNEAQADETHCNAILIPSTECNIQIEAIGEFSAATLFFDLSKFLALLGDAADMLPKNFQIASEKQYQCYFKNHTWHPRMKQLITELQTTDFSPLTERLMLESKVLEIVAIMLEMGQRQTAQQQFISKRDEEKIRYACEILKGDLVNPPGLAQLARLIGSNEFALKKGFKAVFGAPVYQFLQQLRMDRAQYLLLNTDQQIGEVAIEVGYDNLSAFTRAFRQRHGMVPSEMRKTPFRHI